jgi:2-(1,2-epoxy-1,2-dihydrophenyl)acetyl-CoA isomerase
VLLQPVGDSASVLVVDEPAPHVARVLINRPEKRNAIDESVRRALLEFLSGVLSGHAHRALVIGGTGGNFSAGGDVPSMGGLSEEAAHARMQEVQRLCRLVSNADIPVIAAIEGIAAGAGVGIALLGDCIIAGEGARIIFPFMKLGLTPDWATLFSLPRRVGVSAARRLLMQSQTVPGSAALNMGLADVVVPDAAVGATAVEKAVEFSALPLGAFAKMKRRLTQAANALEDELAREEDDQVLCLLGEEFREGYAAFKEKRAPNFRALALRGG